MSYSKKTCRHCWSEMPTPAFICPYCRYSQFTATKDILNSQKPLQNDSPENHYSNGNDLESTIGALIICSPIFALVIWLWIWLLSPS